MENPTFDRSRYEAETSKINEKLSQYHIYIDPAEIPFRAALAGVTDALCDLGQISKQQAEELMNMITIDRYEFLNNITPGEKYWETPNTNTEKRYHIIDNIT